MKERDIEVTIRNSSLDIGRESDIRLLGFRDAGTKGEYDQRYLDFRMAQ